MRPYNLVHKIQQFLRWSPFPLKQIDCTERRESPTLDFDIYHTVVATPCIEV